jgi:hypothetical protein
MEYGVRHLVPVVEITKKPPVQVFPADGFLYAA